MPRIGITAYDLLISCPSDVNEYVEVVRDCLDGFNRTIGSVNDSEIVGKHWSTDSYPQSGDKPQELLNRQFVRDCDAAVAIFWTKFGTPTDKYGSGTEEEVEEMLSSGKQVFMYFVDAPINPSNVDTEQYNKVCEFKDRYKDRGIYDVVKDENELRKSFTNHLTMHFLPLISKTITTPEKKLNPLLKIRSADLVERDYINIEQSNFLQSEFIEEKASLIVEKIKLLNSYFLPEREIIKDNVVSSDTSFNYEIDMQKLAKATEVFGKLSETNIPEQWQITISEFAKSKNVNLDNKFWNVGNLKKSMNGILPSHLGGSLVFNGSENEKKRYEDIEDLYWNIRAYEEYKKLFQFTDNQLFLKLVISNIGNTFDEDIDIKLIMNKGCISNAQYFMMPGINIIEDILEMNFLEYAYEIESSDNIDEYTGYPMQPNLINYQVPNIFGGVSVTEEYENNKQKYAIELERIFSYRTYMKDDKEILTFHINYLKHNTSMAFPSSLVFDNVPKSIQYEITSKHISDVIKGELVISK